MSPSCFAPPECDGKKRFLNLQNRDFGRQSASGILIEFGFGDGLPEVADLVA